MTGKQPRITKFMTIFCYLFKNGSPRTTASLYYSDVIFGALEKLILLLSSIFEQAAVYSADILSVDTLR